MTPTETGLYGPGDFPADFVTIENEMSGGPNANALRRVAARNAAVDALIELAHDLDARELVLRSTADMERFWSNGFSEGRVFEHKYPGEVQLHPSSPNTGS